MIKSAPQPRRPRMIPLTPRLSRSKSLLFASRSLDVRMMDAAPMLAPLPLDGRQSAMAAGVQRGVRRLFAQLGHASLPEFTLASGRRADVIALAPDGLLTIVEIKSSVADFRADRKWPDYRDFCDRFFFAIPATVPLRFARAAAGLLHALADPEAGAESW